jgi:hypothetical protein
VGKTVITRSWCLEHGSEEKADNRRMKEEFRLEMFCILIVMVTRLYAFVRIPTTTHQRGRVLLFIP